MNLRHTCMLEMVICALLWSIGGVFIKLSPWNGVVLAGARSLIASFVILAYLLVKRIPLRVTRRSAAVAVTLCGTFFCCVIATKLTTAANAIVIQYSTPVFILLYGSIFRHRKARWIDWLTVCVTLLGISLFFFGKLEVGRLSGNLIAILAALFFTGCFLTSEVADYQQRMNGILQGQLLTALIGLPFMFVYDTPFTLPAVGCALALGLLQIGLPYILYGLAMRGCPPLACSLLSVIEPLLNPVWVALFYGEMPGVYALIGGTIVLAAVTAWCVYNEGHPQAA